MELRLRRLSICLFFVVMILPSTYGFVEYSTISSLQEETATEEPVTEEPTTQESETSTSTPAAIYPVDIINAVNDLRIRSGLPALAVHPALMDVAAQTANALAATEGAAGHYRPCNMTLGQLLLVRDFALWGDLSQDGYRSEDWVSAQTVEQAIAFWLSDQLHSDTMLSEHRSHIGAAIAVSDQIYMVIVTALQTPSGKMQWGAEDYLTPAVATKAACNGSPIQNGSVPGDLSQYSMPVVRSTARPDGDVIHEVKYGQTLWSIAIDYGTTIEQIKRLNGLTNDTVVQGWKLLVQKGATQPVPSTPTVILIARSQAATPAFEQTPSPTATPAPNEAAALAESLGENKMVVAALIVSFSVLAAAIVGFRKKKEE